MNKISANSKGFGVIEMLGAMPVQMPAPANNYRRSRYLNSN
jgi:hypothetical protein